MKLELYVFVVGLIGNLYSSRIFGGVGGPFRVEPKRLERCPPDTNGKGLLEFTPYYRRMRNATNTFIFTGNFTIGHDIDDKYSTRLKLSSWSKRGGWTQNAYVITMPRVCTAMTAYVKKQWFAVARSSFGYIPSCPIGKGFLHLEETQVDLNVDGVTHFIYGKWRIDIQTLDDKNNVLGCGRVFVDTVPANTPVGAG